MAAEQKTLKPFLVNLQVGNPIGHQNVLLVPLGGEGHPALDEYILASEAIASGVLTVEEVSEQGSVPELLAINSSDHKILLLDGEELKGAKQNRILNTSIIIPPQEKVRIPVSCVEQGRWHYASKNFASGNYAPSRIRAEKSRSVSRSYQVTGKAESDQGQVWDSIHCLMEDMETTSQTSAMGDVFAQKKETIQNFVEALMYPEKSRGVAVAINGKFVAMDIFDKMETLQKVWERLVRGYVLDAISQSNPSKKTFSAKAAETLLEHIGEISCKAYPSVGLGEDWRFEAEDVVGQALVVMDASVHMSVFANEDLDNDVLEGSRIASPSRRRRFRNR